MGAPSIAMRTGPSLPSGARTALTLLAFWLLITTAWWTLALAPVADPPAWLAAARSVCFGSTASGLPDTYGWLLLAAAPGTMLVAIVVAWGREVVDGLQALSGDRGGRIVLALITLVLAGGAASAAVRISAGLAIERQSFDPAEAGALPDGYPRLDRAVPAFTLVDHEGNAFTAADLGGHVTLVTFAFAHCHTVCPAIVQTMRGVAERLGDQAPAMALVTLDPWRDTPSRLGAMHDEWKLPKRARVLSGEVGDVTAALDGWNVSWKRDEATGDVVHPALVYAIDAKGRIAYAFNNPSVDWLVDAVAKLAADKPGD